MGPQVGEVTRFGRITHKFIYNLSFYFDCVCMTGGVIRQGGWPGLPDRGPLSAGVIFCQVNDSMWGNLPSRGRIRDASNSRKIHFGGGFAQLKVTIESHSTEVAARAASECRRALIIKTRGLTAFFLFTCLATTQ